MEVKVLSFWDGTDTESTKLAELLITMPGTLPRGGVVRRRWRTRRLVKTFEHEIQALADSRFEKNIVHVKGDRITEKSIEVILAIYVVGRAIGAVYKFFKDYNDLRDGFTRFVQDVRENSRRLEEVVHNRVPESVPASEIREEIRSVGGLSILAVGAGFAIDHVVTYVAEFVWAIGFANFYDLKGSTNFEIYSHLATRPVPMLSFIAIGLGATFLGGLVSALVADARPLIHAFLVGLLAVVVALTLLIYAPTYIIPIPTWSNALFILLLIPAAMAGGAIVREN